jgi:hypothetical protein
MPISIGCGGPGTTTRKGIIRIRALIGTDAVDDLESGQPLSEFLEDVPTVSKALAVAALGQAKEALLARPA